MFKAIEVIIKPNFNQQFGHKYDGEDVATVGWKVEADHEIYGDYVKVENNLKSITEALTEIEKQLKTRVQELLDEGVTFEYVEETPEMRVEAARAAAAIEVKIAEEGEKT